MAMTTEPLAMDSASEEQDQSPKTTSRKSKVVAGAALGVTLMLGAAYLNGHAPPGLRVPKSAGSEGLDFISEVGVSSGWEPAMMGIGRGSIAVSTHENCESKGWETIQSPEECLESARDLAWNKVSFSEDMPQGGYPHAHSEGRPLGCALHQGDTLKHTREWKPHFFKKPDEAGVPGGCGSFGFLCICKAPTPTPGLTPLAYGRSDRMSDSCTGIANHYVEHNNYCLGSNGEDLWQTTVSEGNSGLQKCKELCTERLHCSAAEWYAAGWEGNKCFHINDFRQASHGASHLHQWRDAKCFVKRGDSYCHAGAMKSMSNARPLGCILTKPVPGLQTEPLFEAYSQRMGDSCTGIATTHCHDGTVKDMGRRIGFILKERHAGLPTRALYNAYNDGDSCTGTEDVPCGGPSVKKGGRLIGYILTTCKVELQKP